MTDLHTHQIVQSTQLMLNCLSNRDGNPDQISIPETSPEEWSNVGTFAKDHQVAPLLYHRLKNLVGVIQPPESTLTFLRDEYLGTIFRNTHTYKELGQVLKALEKENIPVIVLKGAYLAEKVYSSLALRVIGDLDLLVKLEDLEQANRCLVEIGYHSAHNFDLEDEIASKHSLPPLLAPGRNEIDLHWTLFPPELPFNFDPRNLWLSADTEMLAGVKIFSLSPEHQLIHLCVHFAYMHRFAGKLFHVCDINEALWFFESKLDWKKLLEMAIEYRMAKPTYLALLVAQTLLDAPVPNEYLDQLKPVDYTPEYLEWFLQQLLYGTEFSINLAEIWAPRSFRERTRFFFDSVFWKPILMREKYPRLASGIGLPLAYLLRIGDVIKRQVPAAWRLLTRDPDAISSSLKLQRIEEVEKWFEAV